MMKACIFDMDGLIFDTEVQFSDELKKVMSTYGYTLTYENYSKTIGLARDDARIIMKSLYGDDYPFDEISSKARENLNLIAASGNLRIKKGINELLEYFKSKNIPCKYSLSVHNSKRAVSARLPFTFPLELPSFIALR